MDEEDELDEKIYTTLCKDIGQEKKPDFVALDLLLDTISFVSPFRGEGKNDPNYRIRILQRKLYDVIISNSLTILIIKRRQGYLLNFMF